MQSVKSQIFNYLTKIQKSYICRYIASFVKKDFDKTIEELAEKLVEDQKYYLEINSSRFPWIAEFIDEEEFLNDLNIYIKECRMKCKYKESQKPLIEKQKAYMKEQRKKLREFKQSKEAPTKKQLSYYKKLCDKHKIENKIDTENASKLDLKIAISGILESAESSEIRICN